MRILALDSSGLVASVAIVEEEQEMCIRDSTQKLLLLVLLLDRLCQGDCAITFG